MHTFSGLPGRLGEAPVTPAPASRAGSPGEQFDLVFSRALTANEEPVGLSLDVGGDGDFVFLALKGTATGAYEIRFQLPNGRYMSSARVLGSLAVGSAAFPVALVAPVTLRSGSKIGIDIKDLSGAPNSVQIAVIGLKVYPTA